MTSLARRSWLLMILWWMAPAPPAAAAIFDYARDDYLAGMVVDVESIRGRPVALTEVFALVEAQTELRFAYGNRRLPLHRKFVLDTAGTVTLSRLFLRLSSVLDIGFIRRGRQIVVRPLANDDVLARQPPRPRPATARTRCPTPIPRMLYCFR